MIQIIINSDHSVDLDENEVLLIQDRIQHSMRRFEDKLTRIVVHFHNENIANFAQNEVRCMMEARPSGMDSINVSDQSSTRNQALNHATNKLERKLDDIFGKLDHH